MQVFQHKGKSASATLFVDQSIVCVEVVGALDRAFAAEFMGPMTHTLGGVAPLAAVLLYDRAEIKATHWELFNDLRGMDSVAASAKTPCGIVVAAHGYNEAKRYCDAQTTCGIWREAFIERAAAVSWAKSIAALRHMQIEHGKCRAKS